MKNDALKKRKSHLIIVIDGPAGAGKSSTAREIARRTGIDYADSGAVYRGFTLLWLRTQCEPDQLPQFARERGLRFDFKGDDVRVFLDSEDVSNEIRSGRVNDSVSEVATHVSVREQVTRILKETARSQDVVMEGRDLGTVVFPEAELKFFLTADVKTRAERRFREFEQKGITICYTDVLENVSARDKLDSERAVAPLKKADDSIEIDSSGMTFEEQMQAILAHIARYRASGEQGQR